jgi:hypothetical protein
MSSTMDCSALRMELVEAEKARHKLAANMQAKALTFGPEVCFVLPSNHADLQASANHLRSEVARGTA